MFHSMPSSSAIHQKTTDIELRSRNSKNGVSRLENDSPLFGNRVTINHKILPGETLNSIALHYSVQVSDIKRANGLVADQEIFALSFIRIPLSRLQRDIILTKTENNFQVLSDYTNASSSSSNNDFNLLNYQQKLSTDKFSPKVASIPESNLTRNESSFHQRRSIVDSGKTPLLNDYDDNDSSSSINESDVNVDLSPSKKQNPKQAIKNFFEKTDATVAAARENLSEKSPSLEGGAFHFIGATAPDNSPTKGVWLILASVIIIFVLIPLFFTLMEEQNEADVAHWHQIQAGTSNHNVMEHSFNPHKN